MIYKKTLSKRFKTQEAIKNINRMNRKIGAELEKINSISDPETKRIAKDSILFEAKQELNKLSPSSKKLYSQIGKSLTVKKSHGGTRRKRRPISRRHH
jgi:hypothetical protein